MVDPLLVPLVGIPIGVQFLLAGVVHWDATDVGMNPRKWAAIVGLIPVFGLIAYLLTRSERDYDPTEDPYRDRAFDIHPDRQGEGLGPAARNPDATSDEDGADDTGGDDYWQNRSDDGDDPTRIPEDDERD
ncbi:hypothetical protein [Halovivax limisalsi]|uniref:hypothetical protein n=1 Tax=Halovivax limisalsi TaxID=1453760 RepID=UPI001FFC6EE4|nr:hypothetical protein [Halovivax limisalsi]